MADDRPIMAILAGPNGAGKSSLYDIRVAKAVKGPFINADVIQRDELKDPRFEASLQAARIAEERRRDYFEKKRSFATETVFSHPSKLELVSDAKAIGFRVSLFHVSVEDPRMLVDRVSNRVEEGGHGVPADKILSRYERNAPLIRQAALISDYAEVFDNSRANQRHRWILSFADGRLIEASDDIPLWVQKLYGPDLD